MYNSQLSITQTIKVVATKLKKNNYSAGCVCCFVSLDNGMGVKAYDSMYHRDGAYNNQLKCYSVSKKFAPKPFECFHIQSLDIFCYITERLRPAIPYIGQDWEIDDNEDLIEQCELWHSKNYNDCIKIVDEIYAKTGIELKDNHALNWGYRGNLLMPLDFGVDDGKINTDFTDIEQKILEAF